MSRGAALALAACALLAGPLTAPAWADATDVCRFDADRLPEISGLAYSTIHDDVVWTHNDSGGGPRIYALDIRTCEVVAVVTLRGVPGRDMEAIAAGVDARGRHVLWVGDTGDNQAVRSTVSVYELPEPEELRNRSVTPTRYSLRYSRPQDAEALIADPDEDQLWLISKGILGGSVWEVPRPMRSGDVRGLRKIGQEGGLVTDAAMAPDGSRYAVRDYTEVRIYEGKPVGELIARMPLPDQVQGEAMTWAPDGRSLLVASESDDRLLRVDLPEEAWMHSALPQPAVTEDAAPDVAPTPDATTPGDATGAAPSPAPVANPVLEPVDRVGGLAVMALAIGAGVFVLSAIAVAVVARVRSPRS